MSNIRPQKRFKIDLDAQDALPVKDRFHIPVGEHGEKVYLCGHSLGLAPNKAKQYLEEQLQNWQNLAVEGHFYGDSPWIDYLEDMERTMSSLVGAERSEVVIMNSLTANIHFLLAGFYRPSKVRYKVIMEAPAFGSDIYAVSSHLKVRNVPDDALIFWEKNSDSQLFEISDLKQLVEAHADELALIFVGGLNYLNGELLPIEEISRLAHANDILIGLDLAHAAGNVVLKLHEWEIDFACWCTYKYLNGGPGSIGACFIHEKHHSLTQYFQGWWGNSRVNRFEMLPYFTATPSAAGWQLSNPPIMALPPLKASLELFAEFGMDKLRQKSILLTGYLEQLIMEISSSQIQVSTPSLSDRRGAMLCIELDSPAQDIFENIMAKGIVIDYRRPNTIRVAPHPLYNTFDDCYRFAQALGAAIGRS